MKDFRRLKVWEKAHQLALTIYKTTKEFPKEELYGLTSQIRRAKYQLILARDLGFLPNASYENLQKDVEEIKRMLASLLKTLRADR